MNLYIKETGQNNPETIIFIHSDSMAGWMWDEQLKDFKDYHCLIPDLPEHGKSQNTLPFTIKVATELIMDIIKEKAHGGKAHLVGISMGAQIILEILNTSPEIVDHALISGTPVNSTPLTENFLKLLDYLMEKYIPVKNDNLTIGSYIRSYGIPKNLIKKFKESTYVIGEDSAERITREKILFQIPPNLEKADVPVLVMTGEKDYKFIRESAKKLLKTLPNSRGATAWNVGHMWNIENPELFNNVLRRWIQDEKLPAELENLSK